MVKAHITHLMIHYKVYEYAPCDLIFVVLWGNNVILVTWTRAHFGTEVTICK
jgi:hypothetical protein